MSGQHKKVDFTGFKVNPSLIISPQGLGLSKKGQSNYEQ